MVRLAGLIDGLELRTEDRLSRLHCLGFFLTALGVGRDGFLGRRGLCSASIFRKQHFKIIEVGLDVRGELFFLGAGECADVFTDLDDWSGDVKFLVWREVAEDLRQGSGDGEERLARTRPTEAGHEFDLRVKECIEENPLLEVLRDDAHAAGHLQSLPGTTVCGEEFAVKSQRDKGPLADVPGWFGPSVRSQHHVFVDDEGRLGFNLYLDLGEFAEILHGSRGNVDGAIIPDIAGFDAIVAVVLYVHPEGLGLECHAGIFRYEYHGALGSIPQVQG